MNIEGLMCSKSQGRFTFVFLKKLWKVLRLLLSVVLSVQVFRYCRRMSPDVPFEKDINICRKRFAWRNPILGRFEPDWKPFLTSRELFWQDNTPARRQLNYLLQFHMLPFGLKSSGTGLPPPQAHPLLAVNSRDCGGPLGIRKASPLRSHTEIWKVRVVLG
ncbi:unnamed protein product [Lepidochelys olivacea]